MGLLERFSSSFRRDGPIATFNKFIAAVYDRQFDARYQLETAAEAELGGLTIKGANREHGRHYQGARVLVLRRLFRMLRSDVPPETVFVDFGCGKGRVLLIAMEFGFKEVKGVEFARELCAIANHNIAHYKSKRGLTTPCNAIEADATTYPIDPCENVFFMYNPFDETILAKVADNIAASGRAHPRKITVIYLNPRCSEVFAQKPEFVLTRDSDIWGNRYKVYTLRG
jgi:SAM-dependent methyltransferase